jgi:hypothetical protein
VKRRNLVKSVLNNSLLNANTEGARTTGLGRAFQIGTILQEKEFLNTLFFANGTVIR